jgi:MFS family permease
VLWGFGAALAVPVGIAAASDNPMRAAGRVAVVSSFASVASIAAPPLLGIAAASTGARHALVLIAVAMVASVLLARNVAPARPSMLDVPERHDDDEPLAHLADADPDPYAAIVARHADHLTVRRRSFRRHGPRARALTTRRTTS